MSTELTLARHPERLIDQHPELAASTKLQYIRALRRYLNTGRPLSDVDALVAYAADLPHSSRSFLKAAVRVVTEGLALHLKGQATPDNVAAIQAALLRIEAMQGAIQVRQPAGSRAHTWLNQKEVRALQDACKNGIVGQRDRLVMGLLVCAGLRAGEVAALEFGDIALLPVEGRVRTVLNIRGKGGKLRPVPISDALANAIDTWGRHVGHQGRVARSLGMAQELGEGLTPAAIADIVAKRGAQIGKPDLRPHDLRRTYAQLGYEAGIPLTQISKLLGHANVATTQRYLNLELDLSVTASDFIPF